MVAEARVAETEVEGNSSVASRTMVLGTRNRADTRNTAEPFDGSVNIGGGVEG